MPDCFASCTKVEEQFDLFDFDDHYDDYYDDYYNDYYSFDDFGVSHLN